MSKSDTTENDVLKMILQGVDPAYRASSTLYLALHTASPGESGSATTNETTYTGYARQALTKATAWTDGGATFTNAALITFPMCSAVGAQTLTHFSIVTTASGAGQVLYYGNLVSSLTVDINIRPQFGIGALSIAEV